MIKIDYEKPKFLLTFYYNEADLKIVKALPIREWNKQQKRWEVHELAVKSLEHLQCKWTDQALVRKEQINKALMDLIDCKFHTGSVMSRNGLTLRQYQSIGVEFLKTVKKGILADDMGLGKTVQAIMSVLDVPKVLILVPATLKLNWYNEFVNHFHITPLVITGNKQQRQQLWEKTDVQFVIANYDLLQRDWNYMPKKWDAIIADEAVYIKSHQTTRTKLVKKLSSPIKIALSGLPMENNLLEFHSIMEWVRPEVVPPFHRFRFRYCNYDWGGKIVGYKNLKELHLLTSPFILRRKKENVLQELPPKIYSDIPLELDDDARRAYSAIRDEFIVWLNKQTGTNWSMGALEKLIRLRQFVEFPSIVGFDGLSNVKLEWLKELVMSVDKVVVFSFFKTSIDALAQQFGTQYVLTGDTKNESRIPMIDSFNKENKAVLLCTDAGRFGINITGADTIVQYGNFFNPATMLQREDRLHRIGQLKTVHVLSPYVVGTVDEGIRQVFLKRKQDVMNFIEGSFEMDVARLGKVDFIKMVG